MNRTRNRTFLPLVMATLVTVSLTPIAQAGPRQRPANPRGVADPRGEFDPRGPFDPRNPARSMYGLPTGYAMRTYAGVKYYYCSRIYHYPYIINGQTVYTRCTVVNGVPFVPGRPY